MKRSIRSFKRRYLTRRRIDAPNTALFWWGSDGFAGGPTIGDVMAVENLSSSLAAADIPNAIISHPELCLTGHLAADDIYALKRVERLVFVCGPITDNRNLRDLLISQRSARKIAVGVSVLPNHERMNRRFDRIVARDGLQDSYFDLAPATAVVPRYDPSFSRVGLCLRGPQSEYGRSRPEQSAKAAEIFAHSCRVRTLSRLIPSSRRPTP